ncbi:flagellar biosynthesis anti-sigma factor FlgM [Alkalihalophilus marmarensis]|uniref:flagellar biosynthesis anti-sigma factor FlgM n=1 Tax=Alkalihalophilus marmarensis TaxID=521377 RepID=UPI002DB94575|nr:flagellar biosynthesis anti-sigma factor FlgM [Alkalihalophilus marmarensis]MEC2071270.1 flagellar biosynthesis anti-sigma factor FlgM [Alkalihalophilus marmarensis]
MKINPYQSVQQNPYRKQVDASEKVQGAKKKVDKLEISTEALEMQKGNPIEKAREEKVEALKKQIEAGEYKVNPEAVAKKMYEFWNDK